MVTKKSRKSIRSVHKRLIKQLDAIFSLFIRERDRKRIGACPFDGREIEQCFHFVTRAKHSIRWHPLNAVGSCAGCNCRYEFDPHFAIQWYIRTYGQDAYDTLIREGNIIRKWSNEDLQKMIDEYREMYKNNLGDSSPVVLKDKTLEHDRDGDGSECS